jgi:hypothetical protein
MRPSSLADDIQAARLVGGKKCALAEFKKKLSPEDRRGLDRAIADPAVSGRAICRALEKRGLVFAVGYIPKHRRGKCISCGRGRAKR